MTAELKTAQAVQGIEQNGSVPSWLKTWQTEGRRQFEDALWPTRKTEAWKYTPLKSLQTVDWSKKQGVTTETGVHFAEWNEIRIDIVNGVVENIPELPAGLSLVRVSELPEAEGLSVLAKVNAERANFLFDSLNQGLLDQGYLLRVEAGVTVSDPIQLNYISHGSSSLINTQLVVELGQRSSLTLAETFSHDEASVSFTNPNTALFVDEQAKLTHYHLLLEEGDVHHIGRVTATLNRFSSLTAFHMAVGGRLKRKDIHVRHRGEGAELSLNGVYLPKGHEVIDYHTCIEHEVPHCNSEEIFRGIIGDHGKAVFNGRIHIHPQAQKSVAQMNNRNLLLSPHAEIDTKPELEIYADDVRCAHGATIAQLDEKSLFYFQSRGIAKKEAEVMLSFGFINELLDGLADQPVQQLLRPLLASLFAKKQSELVRHIL